MAVTVWSLRFHQQEVLLLSRFLWSDTAPPTGRAPVEQSLLCDCDQNLICGCLLTLQSHSKDTFILFFYVSNNISNNSMLRSLFYCINWVKCYTTHLFKNFWRLKGWHGKMTLSVFPAFTHRIEAWPNHEHTCPSIWFSKGFMFFVFTLVSTSLSFLNRDQMKL